eukprot:2107664-Amphidinium_carterae.1
MASTYGEHSKSKDGDCALAAHLPAHYVFQAHMCEGRENMVQPYFCTQRVQGKRSPCRNQFAACSTVTHESKGQSKNGGDNTDLVRSKYCATSHITRRSCICSEV